MGFGGSKQVIKVVDGLPRGSERNWETLEIEINWRAAAIAIAGQTCIQDRTGYRTIVIEILCS